MKKSSLWLNILAGLLWGTSGIFSEVLLSPFGFSSLQLTATRGIVSGIAIALFALFFRKEQFKVKAKHLLLYVAVGISLFATAAFYYISIRRASPSTAAVLMNTSPAFVMTVSVIFFKEKLGKSKLFALIAMLIGCMLVSGIDFSGMRYDFWGILSGLAAGVSTSIYYLLSKVEFKFECDPFQATLYHFIAMGTAGLFFLDLPSYTASVATAPLSAIPLLIALGLVTCVIPYFLCTLSMKHLSAGVASALAIIEPMSATVYSAVLTALGIMNETFTVLSVIGIVLILGACVVLERSE